MKAECAKDMCTIGADGERDIAGNYKQAAADIKQLADVVGGEDLGWPLLTPVFPLPSSRLTPGFAGKATWTPTDSPTTKSPSLSPSLTPSNWPSLVPSESGSVCRWRSAPRISSSSPSAVMDGARGHSTGGGVGQ